MQRLVLLCVALLFAPVVWAQTKPPAYDFVRNGVQNAKVDNSTGVPRLLINGQPVPPLLFFFNSGIQDRLQHLAPEVKLAQAAGVRIYSFGLDNWPWDTGSKVNPSDFSPADQIMDRYLQVDPQAVFLLRIDVRPPWNWSGWTGHSDWGKNEDNLYWDGTSAIVSVASEMYFQAFIAAVRQMVQHYESSAYAPHILGYNIVGQNTGEWFPMNYRDKGLDYSPASATAFRNWLRQKYGTDQSLSKAWGRSVALSNAPIPLHAPDRFPHHAAVRGDVVQEFYSLPSEQDWVDYSDYISDITSSRILAIARTVRAASNGKRIIAFFYGYIYELSGSMNGHLRTNQILASPDVDMVCGPISYIGQEERLAGGAAASMSARDSVALHGKLWMNEDDLRTYLSDQPELLAPSPPTSDFFETYNVLLRNLASTLIHRGGTWWMDLSANGNFNNADVWKVMSDFGLPLYNETYANPAPYRPEVAVITDERSVLYQKSDWDFLHEPRSLLRNRIAKTGASVGFYDVADFTSGLLPRAKVYVFANAFYLTDDQIGAIRSRLQSEGATAIWQYAPGYLGPNGPDVTRSTALTGIQLSISGGYSGSTGASLLAGQAWGWGWQTPWTVLTPRLVVSDPDATILGRYWSDNAASTAYKRANGFTSVFVGDVGWTTNMIRPLLAGAGVHIWTSAGDVIHTDGSLLVLHAASAGARSVSLPAGVTGTPLGGSTPTTNPQPLLTSFSRTGETQWFRLSQASQASQAPAVQPWTGLVNSASLQSAVAAGGWITVFGANLSAASRTWNDDDFVDGKLPTQLDGVGVKVNGTPAYVCYISPTQVYALLPASLTGSTVSVEVVTPRGKSDAVLFPLSPVAPALFVFDPGGRKYAAAVFPGGSYCGPAGLLGSAAASRPAKPGDIIELYATSLGQTNPQAPDGVLLTTSYPLKTTPVVTLGGTPAKVQFAGLVSPGLYQINIVIPQLADGDAALQVAVSTASSPSGVFLAIAH